MTAMAAGLLFFLFKVVRFNTLGYTFNDMYAFIQMSCSYMDGRPFMYDNIWGFHHRIHNYYTVLFWGPLCYFLGAYGLFLAQAGLLTASYWLTYVRLRNRQVPAWARHGMLWVLLLGPVSFWLNDHPNIGWHTELTYLPAALFFGLALTSRSGHRTGWVFLSGLLIVLVKEDGAVLAALIQLSWLGLSFLKKSNRSIIALLAQRQFWLIGIGWGVVFLAGMLWLSVKNHSATAEPRLQQALTQLGQHIGTRTFWKEMGQLLLAMLLLLLPAVVLVLLLVRSQGRSVRVGWVVLFGLGIGVLTALNFVQSVLYYGEPLFYLVSLTWPPRFVLMWAFAAAFLLLGAVLYAQSLPNQAAPAAKFALAGLWLVQLPIVYQARPDVPPLATWVRLLRDQPAADKNQQLLQPADLAVVQCIAEQLPARSSVFSFDYLVPYFHKHYGIWPTGNQYQPADIAIIPTADPQHLKQTPAMPKADTSFQLKAYTVYTSRAYAPVVRACLPAEAK